MSAESTLTTYTETALRGAIRSLSFSRQWADRLDALLVERERRKQEDRISEAPEQYQHNRGCPP